MDTETFGIGMAILGILIMQANLYFWLKKIVERADWNVEDLNGKIWHLESEDEETFRQLCVAKQQIEKNIEDQVKVNVHFSKDINDLEDKMYQLKKELDAYGSKKVKSKK